MATIVVCFSCKTTHNTSSSKNNSEVPKIIYKDPYTDKICIDTLNTKLLVNKWYDISPRFKIEQPNFTFYLTNSPEQQQKEMTSSIREFKLDGTYELTVIRNGKTNILKGTWGIISKTRTLKIKLEGDEKYSEQSWTIIELNENFLLMKAGRK
jgi:hypothetical protein